MREIRVSPRFPVWETGKMALLSTKTGQAAGGVSFRRMEILDVSFGIQVGKPFG